jgi:hypothetical protein
MALGNLAAWRRLSAIVTILFGVSAILSGCANVKGNASQPVGAVSVAVSPSTASVTVAGTQKFTATVSGASSSAVTWQVNGTAGGDATHGKIDATGMYTAPAAVPSPAAVTVTAVSVAAPTKSGSAQVTVSATPPAAVSVSSSVAVAAVQVGKTLSLTASVANDSANKGVTWALTGAGCTGAACGTLSATSSASGTAITYTAPAAVPTPAAVTATATSVADTTKSASTVITVSATPIVIGITVAPTTASVAVGATQTITATVTNDFGNKGVSLALSGTGCTGAKCGTLAAATTSSGTAITYTAPTTIPSPATVTITATALADTTKTASATFTITAAAGIAVSINPTTVAVQIGKTQAITATVANDSANKGVTYALSGTGCTGAACGTLSAATGASGVAITYTAPAAVPSPATVTVTATSVADATKKAAATITISATPTGNATVSILPKRVALTTGQLQTFVATVTGNANTAVTWEVDTIPGGNATVGTVSATGVYTPATTAGTHTVGARSAADTTVVATASVAITDLTGIFTYHNDLARDGVNSKEYALNTTTVAAATFGKRFSCAVDAQAYAQPLWVANVTIGGAKHNVVIAETMHNTIYAFDADASPCVTLWTKSLMASGETYLSSTDVNSTDISPDIGIVGTPVIDPATSTIYVVSKSKNGSTVHQRLHALSLIDGSEKFAGPTEIAFSAGGFTFDPLRENERCGLALVNGIVYIAWASHGDQGPYYGWIVGYNASTLAQVSVYNDDPHTSNQTNAGIWMSGGAPAADNINGTTSLYVITGNGPFDGVTYFGDSFLKLSTGNSMTTSSFFTPHEQQTLENNDTDLGSGGTAVLVDQPTTPNHLLIGGGKEGFMYVLNRDSLGGYNTTDSGAVQIISTNNGIFATPAFWQGTLYIGSAGGNVKAYSINSTTGRFGSGTSSTSPTAYNWPGATPSVSSQGTANGIVWALERNGAAILHAYDATNLGTELWNSAAKAADASGSYVKFTVPTVANGKVYVGTATEIDVYGLSPN